MAEQKTDSICEKITFSSEGFALKGYLHLPAGKSVRHPVVIGSHGLLSTGNSQKQIALAEVCNKYSIAFFRFGHRGCGESQGNFRDVTSLEARHRDLISAAETVRSRNDIGKQTGLFGSSMGGATCLSAAKILGVHAIVTFAAPIRSNSIVKAVENPGDSDMSESLIDREKLQFDISDRLYEIHNILIFHGDSDTVVPPSQAVELYEKAGETKKLVMQERGDHPMNNTKHQEIFMKETVAWFRKFLVSS
ncbi:MAG: alpha/beta hydrolase [Desulfobacteraceae bacterium]|nr:alpha/beta hydrolase [Desulfobacteraceae bacterium]